MKSSVKAAFLSLLLILLAACAGTDESSKANPSVEDVLAEKNLRIVEEINQLINFNIRGWQYVNWENVILEDGPSRIYLVELTAQCRELQWAQRIAFTSFGRAVTRNERIMVTDGGGYTRHCLIKALYELEKIPKQ